MYTTPSSPQRTPEQLIALRRSFSRIAGGSPAFPSHSRFTGGSPVRHSRIAGGSPAVSVSVPVSRIAGGSPAIPSMTTGSTDRIDDMSVKDLWKLSRRGELSRDDFTDLLIERLCDASLPPAERDMIKDVLAVLSSTPNVVVSPPPSERAICSPLAVGPVVEAPSGAPLALSVVGEGCDVLGREPACDWPDTHTDVGNQFGGDVLSRRSDTRSSLPPNHVIVKAIGQIGGKLLWNGKKLKFRLWKKRFVASLSEVVACFKSMVRVGPLDRCEFKRVNRLDDSEFERINTLLYTITFKAVPDTIMQALERESEEDGVGAWVYLNGLYNMMTEEELDALGESVANPSRCTHANQILDRIEEIHDARAVLESFGRNQYQSALKAALFKILPSSMDMHVTTWKIGASIEEPGSRLNAREVETLIRQQINPLATASDDKDEEHIMLMKSHVRCFGCGSHGHVRSECSGSIRCSSCGKTGHHRSICGRESEFKKECDEAMARMRGNNKQVTRPLYNNIGKQKLYTVDGEMIPGDFDVSKLVNSVDASTLDVHKSFVDNAANNQQHAVVDEHARAILAADYRNLFSSEPILNLHG